MTTDKNDTAAPPAWTKPKPAHPSVAAANAAEAKRLPFSDTQDFEDAARGFMATLPDATITAANGRVVWSIAPYAFLEQETAPDTVNPSLWRQARLNRHHGLFMVTEGIYQVRGFDIANMTIVETDHKIIVIDTLTTTEGARAALDLYRQHRGNRPVGAVIYTHTHTDHWGGVRGVITDDEAKSGAIPVLAPDLFIEHAVSENVIAGNAMLRRAHYQFGPFVAKSATGHVDCGLGKSMAAGSVSLIAPTDLIKQTGEKRVIDGIEVVFQMAPETEAPAEMHMYFPKYKMLNLAENATHNFHNLLPFRGALVRDAFQWSHYLNEALDLWGANVEVLTGQHHWPVWGNGRVQHYVRQQRDLYKFVHDQTLRLANHGLGAADIAEQITGPQSMEGAWHTRGYYGHIRHNSKAVYQRYLGWYDGIPAHLDPLPPVPAAHKMMTYMGGIDAVVAKAKADFEKGEFRFVAEVLNHAVFSDPTHLGARALLADTYEQLGYLAESATWRNAYLAGAMELRFGPPKSGARPTANLDTIMALRTGQFFDYLAVRLNGKKAEGLKLAMNWRFTDTGETYVVNVENAALTWTANRQSAAPNVTLTLDRRTLDTIMARTATFADTIATGAIKLEGNPAAFKQFLSCMDEFARMFPIVEPRSAQDG